MKHTIATLLLLVTVCLVGHSVFAEKLRFAAVYHRHGARNTLHNYGKTAPELGQLTPAGMRQLFLLGREFRRKYIEGAENTKILPTNYDPTTLWVRSTAVNRTLQSAQAFLAGLYPSGPKMKDGYDYSRAVPPFKTDFDVNSLQNNALPHGFQPIPVHTVTYDKDYLLHAYEKKTCHHTFKKYDKLAKERDDYAKMMTAFKPTYDKIIEVLGLKDGKKLDMEDMSGVIDYFYSNYFNGIPIEHELTQETWNDMMLSKNISGIYNHYSTKHEQNVYTTQTFEELLFRMDRLLEGKSNVTFVEYSAHDYTVNLLLSYFNITSWNCLYEKFEKKDYTFDEKCPWSCNVGCTLTIELWQQEDGRHTVKLLYNNYEYPFNKKMNADYSEFAAHLRTTIVPNFWEHCIGVSSEPKEPENPTPVTETKTEEVEQPSATWRIVVLAIQGLIIIALTWSFLHTRKEMMRRSLERGLLAQ